MTATEYIDDFIWDKEGPTGPDPSKRPPTQWKPKQVIKKSTTKSNLQNLAQQFMSQPSKGGQLVANRLSSNLLTYTEKMNNVKSERKRESRPAKEELKNQSSTSSVSGELTSSPSQTNINLNAVEDYKRAKIGAVKGPQKSQPSTKRIHTAASKTKVSSPMGANASSGVFPKKKKPVTTSKGYSKFKLQNNGTAKKGLKTEMSSTMRVEPSGLQPLKSRNADKQVRSQLTTHTSVKNEGGPLLSQSDAGAKDFASEKGKTKAQPVIRPYQSKPHPSHADIRSMSSNRSPFEPAIESASTIQLIESNNSARHAQRHGGIIVPEFPSSKK